MLLNNDLNSDRARESVFHRYRYTDVQSLCTRDEVGRLWSTYTPASAPPTPIHDENSTRAGGWLIDVEAAPADFAGI